MRNVFTTFAALACAAFAGCATAPASPPAGAVAPSSATQVASAKGAREPRIVCERELPTGRRVPVVTCREADDIEEGRDRAREALERVPVTPHDVLTGR